MKKVSYVACLAAVSLLSATVAPAQTTRQLAEQFSSPPASAKPWLWWHWMNGNISQAGITKDLEAMSAAGVGGVILFEEGNRIGPGPVRYFSPEHFALIEFAGRECDRLGLQFGFQNCPGWSSSGGPWVTPEYAMKHVTWSEQSFTGGKHVSTKLPRPSTTVRPYPELGPPERYERHDKYWDVAVIAFPAPKDSSWRLGHWQEKAGFRTGYHLPEEREDAPAGSVIDAKAIVDVTKQMKSDGTFEWDAPAGTWTILRLGYTLTEHTNRAAPTTGAIGLEIDKFSREAVDFYWKEFDARVLTAAEKNGAKANTVLMDSYEPLTQTWTPQMREDFQRLRGYDLFRYLPCLTGRAVNSVEESQRFLWDYRRTLADLGAENYFGAFADKCHQHGLVLAAECYGYYGSFFDEFAVNERVDIPMGEFWTGTGKSKWTCWTSKLAASGADIAGRHLVGAEAYTAGWNMAAWRWHPYTLKAEGDYYFCRGVNRFYVQASAHQPWADDIRPGMTFGPHGIQMNRNNTWFAQSRAWLSYLTRCQYVLQHGRLVTDVYFDYGDDAPATLWPKEQRGKDWSAWNADEDRSPNMWLQVPPGHDFHIGNGSVVRQMEVSRDGALALPDGQSYRVLLLPDDDRMQPDLLRKIADLVRAGATVVGPRPTKSPTLQPAAGTDATLQQLADALWGDIDGKRITAHRYGKGTVWFGVGLDEVLSQQHVAPDFEYRAVAGTGGKPSPKLDYMHRQLADGEYYFVSNQRSEPTSVECVFRTANGSPELWQPESGRIEAATLWRVLPDGRTEITLNLSPAESCFVVFHRSTEHPAIDAFLHDGRPVTSASEASLTWEGQKLALNAFANGTYTATPSPGLKRTATITALPPPVDLSHDWVVRFPNGSGAPQSLQLAKLASLSKSPNDGVKYFSGTATYTKTVQLPAGALGPGNLAVIDLGDVEVIAELIVNGRNMGTLWKPPFRQDITTALRPGANELAVKVTTLWPNRLIGDASLRDFTAAEAEKATHADPYLVPDWVTAGKPNPDRRGTTFTLFQFYSVGAPLLPSGLIGPARLVFGKAEPLH